MFRERMKNILRSLRCTTPGTKQAHTVLSGCVFESDSPLPELVKTVPHVAFEVDDLQAAIDGKDILIEPNSPFEGVTVALIVDNGAPIEFLQFEK